MKAVYFKKAGYFFWPIHPVGWLATAVAIALYTWFFILSDRNSHSVSDTLSGFFVYATCLAFWFKWFAGSTSDKPDFTS